MGAADVAGGARAHRAIPEAGGWLRAPLHTAGLIRDPRETLRALAARHGPTFRMWLLDGPSIVSGDAAFVAAVFAADATCLDAPNDIVAPLVGDGSIVLANGERHRRKRKLMAPPFHGPRLRDYGRVIADATLRAIGAPAPGATVDVLGLTQRLSLDVIMRAVFGVRDPARLGALRDAIAVAVAGFPTWLMFSPPLHRGFGGVGPWSRYQRAVASREARLRDEIARARAAPEGSRDDVLALLLSARDEDGRPMPDDELVSELRTLVIAGHETTATTLAWALWEVHRAPALHARLVDALQRPRPMRSSGLQSLAVLLSALAGCAIDERAISRARDVDAGLGCPAGQRACDGLCERPSDFVPPAGSLRAWFDAACLAPGRLAVWADRSVAANHATAPSTVAAPEVIARGLGGRAAVRFDGVGQHLTLPDGAAPGRNGPFTVVVAGSWDDVATTYNGVIGWGGTVGVHVMVNPGGNVFLWWGDRTAASVTAPASSTERPSCSRTATRARARRTAVA